MKIIIPTRGRADVIGDKALCLFPDATLCVGEDEVDAYGAVSDRPCSAKPLRGAKHELLVHPGNVVGIGPLRQWVLDHVDDPCVVMVDDDVTNATCGRSHISVAGGGRIWPSSRPRAPRGWW